MSNVNEIYKEASQGRKYCYAKGMVTERTNHVKYITFTILRSAGSTVTQYVNHSSDEILAMSFSAPYNYESFALEVIYLF